MLSDDDLSYFEEYYWSKKRKLIEGITGEVYQNGGHPKHDAAKCQKCEKGFPLSYLTFHHPREERGERDGGMSVLLEVEKDLDEGNEVQVLCWDCHKEEDPQLNFKSHGRFDGDDD